jgi:energy-coupling factor transport system ATP-binding protein
VATAARLSALSYWYPGATARALSDVSMSADGGITLVTGPSGGGKSTLLRVFNGLVPHFHGGRISGSAEVAGLDVVRTPTRTLARSVGFVFQDPELQTVYDSVEREVAFGLENAGMPAAQMPGRVDEALERAGARHLRGRAMRTLSGGERQRVELASVLAMRPSVLVLDEPTSQLDGAGAELVLEAVREVAARGCSVVVAEHRMEPLLAHARAVVEVDGGRARSRPPEMWSPPAKAPPEVRATVPGGEAWSLRGVTAGHPGHAVVREVDLCGREAEVVVLCGPNGGGKTTLLRTIAGLLQPLAGVVERRPGRIAYLPQNPGALLHRPTVRSEVQLTLDRAHDRTPAAEILAGLRLEHVAERYPRDLSAGERQRAAIAAVLAGRPRLVLLDEPTRGMDAKARAALVRVVAAMRDGGSSVVLATHDAELQAALADRMVEVDAGRARARTEVKR